MKTNWKIVKSIVSLWLYPYAPKYLIKYVSLGFQIIYGLLFLRIKIKNELTFI